MSVIDSITMFGSQCPQGNAEAAIRVERLTNRIAKTYDVDILCGYCMSSVFWARWAATFSKESVRRIQQFIPAEMLIERKRQRKFTIDKCLGRELRDSRSSDRCKRLRADWTNYPH
jgi:hypothetical protein